MSQSRAALKPQSSHSHLTPVSQQDHPIRQTTVKAETEAGTTKAATSPRWLWLIKNWKYNIDRSSHWVRQLYFYVVFLNFLRFSYAVFKLAPPSGRDKDGRFIFLEDQGACEERWQAEQEGAKYPFGEAVRIPLNAPLPAATVRTEQLSPNSPKLVQEMYKRNGTGHDVVPVPRLAMVQLAAQVEATGETLRTRRHVKA